MPDLERRYSIGAGVIERYEIQLLEKLPALYNERDRAIVETILLPHFRKQLQRVFDAFQKTNSIKISELCQMFDEMVRDNAELLDVTGIFKPIMARIRIIRKKIAKELERQAQNDFVIALARHNITDRRSLLACGPIKFTRLRFGEYGLGKSFISALLGKSVRKLSREMTGMPRGNVTLEILARVADALNLPEFSEATKDKCKAALKKHGITDRESLVDFNPARFDELDFGEYGKGQGFAGFVLSRSFKGLRKKDLKQIADLLEMKKRPEVDKKEAFLHALANHQITDRLSLITCGVVVFRRLSFGSFGGAKVFLEEVLGRKIASVSLDIFQELADILQLPQLSEVTLVRCKVALAKHGIMDRDSLMDFGTVKFSQTDFGLFKKGPAFVNAVLGRNIGVPNKAILGEFADALGI
ncbi:hypothetical protein HYW83_04605 [Candidatus Peregrinibacteria bacterium]|nr:hypothetical protein [Candidatus Peregrinibacteria bacterium]